MIGKLIEQIKMVWRVVTRLVRVGEVVSVDEQRGTVRVEFKDADGVVSYPLPVLSSKTHEDKAIHLPDLGEHVVCIFLPNGQEEGFVLGAFYSTADEVPVASRDKRHIRFKDGSWFEYDRSTHKLSGHVVGGDAELRVDKTFKAKAGESATVESPVIYLLGNVSQQKADGGCATETKNANTTHTGSYRLAGALDVDSLRVRGDSTVDGNSDAGTRSGGAI